MQFVKQTQEEVKPIKTPNFCLFGNAHFGNKSLHTESGDMVKQSDAFGHYEPQSNSTQHGMEAQLRPLLFGGITNTPLSAMEPPQFYGSWSACGDDSHSALSFPDHVRKRTQENVSHFGKGPDVLGLVANILEEPNKQEHVTDWNSLSRLFPPLWSSNFGNYGLESENCNSPGSQKLCEENIGKSSSEGLFKKECEDLHMIRPQFPSSQPFMSSPHELSKMANLDNNASKNGGIRLFNYEKKHSGSTSAPQPQMKDSTNTYREFPKTDTDGGKLGRNGTEGSSKYFVHLSNAAADRIWDPMAKENSLCSKRDFSAAHNSGHFSFSQSLNKENSFPEGIDVKFQEICLHNHSSDTNFVQTECKNPVHPGKGSSHQLPLKTAAENMDSPYNGYTWLDATIQNPIATSSVMYGKQMQINSQLPSGPRSGGPSGNESAAHSPHSPMLSLGRDRKLQLFTDVSNNSEYSGYSGSQKQHTPLGPSQSDSAVRTEGGFGKMPLTASSSCKSQQYSANASSQYQRYHNKQNRNNTDERTGQNERSHKNSWRQHTGFLGPDRKQFDVLRRNQEQNGAILPDYVNPFLPLFPLVSGYKHLPHFPPFPPPPFPSPVNAAAFSLLPFPLSELVDLFRCEDFSHINPFINDLCGGDNTAGPYLAFPPPLNHYRPPRSRSGPANELHIHLEECYEQLRALERERKKAEADLARHFPGKRVSSSSNAPFSRLPAKPSRVDRLIVDQFREQAKVYTLLEKMEHISGSPVHRNISATLGRHLEAIWATQARRKAEVVNSVNPQRQRTSRHHNEKDILALAAAIKDLAFFTRKTRTALWCALQMTLPKTPGNALAKKEEVERALQELCPENSSFQANSVPGHEGKPSKREGHDKGQQVGK
nr:PREDICTED: meiosis-specific coiled-coil domain-containing protein MEIOC isoform X2 [Anolis carolinensis]|eukprot:XP_008110447.1 PREDICTED: meiosis-specific coiled-coil domain-containing protein MEIOC isoform X2 [Anolis carolinensis]